MNARRSIDENAVESSHILLWSRSIVAGDDKTATAVPRHHRTRLSRTGLQSSHASCRDTMQKRRAAAQNCQEWSSTLILVGWSAGDRETCPESRHVRLQRAVLGSSGMSLRNLTGS